MRIKYDADSNKESNFGDFAFDNKESNLTFCTCQPTCFIITGFMMMTTIDVIDQYKLKEKSKKTKDGAVGFAWN